MHNSHGAAYRPQNRWVLIARRVYTLVSSPEPGSGPRLEEQARYNAAFRPFSETVRRPERCQGAFLGAKAAWIAFLVASLLPCMASAQLAPAPSPLPSP